MGFTGAISQTAPSGCRRLASEVELYVFTTSLTCACYGTGPEIQNDNIYDTTWAAF